MQQTMVVLDAATGLRYSEVAGLRWSDVDWDGNCINIERRWIRGNIDTPNPSASKAPVALSAVLRLLRPSCPRFVQLLCTTLEVGFRRCWRKVFLS